jgi:hypothetical protein
MSWLVRVAVAAIALCSSLTALTPSEGADSPRHKNEMRAIRAVIEENFRASNNEDIDGVMDTMTPYTPNKENFRAELKEFFEETDVYTRLVDLTFVSAEMTSYGPAATVRVVQQTLSKLEEDRAIPYSDFRSRSAMLPPWEVCEFEIVLHKVRGKWRAHLMGGDVREAQLPKRPDVGPASK